MDSGKKAQPFDISLKTILKIAGVVLLFWLSWRLVGIIWPIIFSLIVATFLAVGLNPLVARVAKILPGSNRFLAVLLSFLLLLTFLALFLTLVIPPIFNQIIEFASNLDDDFTKFLDQGNFLTENIKEYGIDQKISDWLGNLAGNFDGLQAGGVILSIVGAAFNIVTILVLTFLLLVEGPKIFEQLSSLNQNRRQKQRFERIGKKMYHVITSYVGSQLLVATIGAVVALLFMTIIGFPNPLAMAGVIWLFSLIPMIGVIIAAVIVIAAGLLESFKLAVVMAVYFLVYQQVENVTIQPYIQSRSLPLSVMMIFVAALIGARLGGIWGTFLAIPVAGCLRVLVHEFFNSSSYYKKYLTNRQKKEYQKESAD